MSSSIPEIVHETLLTEAWQNAQVGAVVFDEGRSFLAANRMYLELVGYSREEIADIKPGANIVTDEEGRLAYLDLLDSHERLSGSTPIRRKDGEVFVVNYVIVPTFVSRLPFFMALMWPPEDGRP
jgi:PAS domain S-box-containing protein